MVCQVMMKPKDITAQTMPANTFKVRRTGETDGTFGSLCIARPQPSLCGMDVAWKGTYFIINIVHYTCLDAS